MRAISISKAEGIVHLGALAGPTELIHPWRLQQRMPEDETMRVNTMGTFYLMDAARRLEVKRVVMASTYYVLGLGFRITDRPLEVEYLPIDEDHPNRPESTYGLSKLLGEEILAAFSRAYGLVTIALRLMGVDSPHRRAQGRGHRFNIIPEKPTASGSLEGTTWQYVDAEDVALACRLGLESESLSGFEALYLSTDTVLAEDTRVVVERCFPRLRDLAANLQDREGIISIKKAQDVLGYEPQHSWRSAMDQYPVQRI